ncbi:MAG: MFS transporter [Candidatus Eremiobacteraeota bacterium]|nr:MFS transporter [Candidatus Eremiobacteraeota bacterium]MBV8366063.1 MFS transporter [Candidatus Eremiobacteraeota bacterium]
MSLGRYRALFANRAVALLVVAQWFARLGDQFVAIGLLWAALDLTHSAAATGLVLMAYTGGVIAAGFFAASLLDRYPRKPLMLADNAVRALCIGAIAVLGYAHALNVWALAGLAALAAISSTITIVGMRVYMPTMVPEELIVTAFAVDSSLYQLAGILGPAVAGIVTATLGWHAAMAIAAVCFAMFVAIASFIQAGAIDSGIPPEARELSISQELAGARYIYNNPLLRGLTLMISMGNFFFGIAVVALAFLSKDAFAAGARGQGYMLAAISLGSLLSSIALGAGRWPYPRGISLILDCVILGVLVAAVGFAPTITAAYLVLFVVGAVDAAFFIWMSELRQRTPPPELLARTISASMILNTVALPFSSAIAGLAVGLLHVRPTFVLAGVLTALYSALFFGNKPLREAP